MPPRLLKILLVIAAVVIAFGAYLYLTREEPAPTQPITAAQPAPVDTSVWTGACDQRVDATFVFGPTRILVSRITYTGLDGTFARVAAEVFITTAPSEKAKAGAKRWIPNAFRLTTNRLQWRGQVTQLRDRGENLQVKLRFRPLDGADRGVPSAQLKRKNSVGLSISVPNNGSPVVLGLQPPSGPGDASCLNKKDTMTAEEAEAKKAAAAAAAKKKAQATKKAAQARKKAQAKKRAQAKAAQAKAAQAKAAQAR